VKRTLAAALIPASLASNGAATRTLRLALRFALLLAVAAAYAAVVAGSEQPLAMAVGLAPLAGIALEAVWRLFDTRR
jgi:hypothetical protein